LNLIINGVYDLLTGEFRSPQYDDYISVTAGYNWREPTEEELITMNNIIMQILPNNEERQLTLELMSTGLEGRPLERFILENGSGGNGKSLMNDILLSTLGKYAMVGNNAILFEKPKTGSQPEKAVMHKKRLVIFREPGEKCRFENSVIKEMTGGGVFSARSLYEVDGQKILHCTIFVECNRRPLFSEDPTRAEARRLIDLHFSSEFVFEAEKINHEKHIYKANIELKNKSFQEKHRFALFKILSEAYKKYKTRNYEFVIPKNVEERTKLYLELSSYLIEWFKDNYTFTDNLHDFCKAKDIFDNLAGSEYYNNLTKADRRKYNKSYFMEYITNNEFFKEYFIAKSGNLTSIIRRWQKK
jgi:phage/plasmid-associated DNA primase